MTTTIKDFSQVIIVNPEYVSLVPKISDSQYKEIKQDIQEHGQHVPIIINQKGEILDGLTRNRICQELEIEPRTMLCSSEYEDPLLAKQFIININRNRRQLDTFQRIELEYKLEPIEAQLAKKRQSEAGADKKSDHSIQNYTKRSEEQKKGRVIDIAAKRAQVSPMTYFKGRELIKKESPEILNWKEIPVNVVSLADILKGESHENSHRKSFTSTETIEIKRELEKRETVEAKRQRQRDDIPLISTESWDESEPHDTRDKVAGYFGIGWKKLDQLEDIVNAANENAEKFGDLPTKIDKGMRVNTAWKTIQDEKTKQKARNQKSTGENEEEFFIRKNEITLGKYIQLLNEYPNRKAEIAKFLVEGIEKEISA